MIKKITNCLLHYIPRYGIKDIIDQQVEGGMHDADKKPQTDKSFRSVGIYKSETKEDARRILVWVIPKRDTSHASGR